ncbi:DUF6714 family protein [Marinobacterium stanieri]|uniref:DUF6714 family protein n=1 Tax=Marinobacterium stanieri TaxID=49186 RepID=UPI000970F685|nr:DUF6714 family protein [Marinobacterium stanieri]
MNGIDPGFLSQFKGLPTEPVTSLRGGDAIDEYREAPEYDPSIDRLSPEYLETYFCGITYLDAVSWRYYLPYLLGYTLQKISDPGSMAVDHFLSNLRPPDQEPPRFGSLSPEEQALVVSVLDRLAFSDESVWQDQAMVALEEYWGSETLYR